MRSRFRRQRQEFHLRDLHDVHAKGAFLGQKLEGGLQILTLFGGQESLLVGSAAFNEANDNFPLLVGGYFSLGQKLSDFSLDKDE